MKLRTVICFLALAAIVVLALANSPNSSNAEEDNSKIETRFRISSTSFQQRFGAQVEEKTEPSPYIIGLRVNFKPEGELASGEATAQRAAIAQAQDVLLDQMAEYAVTNVKRFEFIPFMAMTVDAGGLEKLQSLPDVASIEEDIPVPATLAESVSLVNAPAMYSAGFTGSGQTIAILDTGVDKTHSFLTGKVVSEACYSSTVSGLYTPVCPGGVLQSTAVGSGVNCTGTSGCEHGTHVAGIAAGKGPSFSGVARDANLIAIQVFSRSNSSIICGGASSCVLSFTSDQILGLERVLALSGSMNIASVNMSLGSGQNFFNCDATQQSRKAAIDNLRSANIATVISSGNSSFTDSIGAPACISSAISVGSTDDGSQGTTVNAVSSFSNASPFVSLLAPGRWINSSVPGNNFSSFQGTSMAAPHVAGAWAILRQQNPSATVDQILSNLAGSGTPILDNRGSISVWKSRLNLSSLGCAYTRSPGSQNIPPAGGGGGVNITTAGNCNWYARANGFSTYRNVVSNTASINVADSTGGTPGLGSVYPSTINVSGMTGTIFKVNVTLNGITHTNPDDLDIILIHPNGSTRSILMSDAGGNTDINNLTLTFDEQAPAGFLPDETALTGGSFFTTNRNGSEGVNDNFPAPGPGSASYGAFLNFFNGLSPNGDWKLYVVDDATGETGGISGGWSLEIFTKTTTSWLSLTSPANGAGNGTVNFTAAANTFTGTRTGTLNVAGQNFTVTQDGGAAGAPTISINNVSLNEGNGGTTNFTFNVTLSSQSSQTVTVNYATANGTAAAPTDYQPANGTLTFNPNETSKQVTVLVNGDTTVESNENFFVNLSNAVNATISDNQGEGTIVNDDSAGCTYSINPTSQNFSRNSGTGSVSVTTQPGCAWTAASNSFSSFIDDLYGFTNKNNAVQKIIDSVASPRAVFSNTTPIAVPGTGTIGAGNPFPSNITVSGMTGTVTDVNVRINQFTHTFPDDTAFLLVSPDGRKFVLQSDVGGGTGIVNLTYTLDDQAASSIPDAGPMPSNNGSAKPSSVGDDDAMPAPAPPIPYQQPAPAGTATLNGTFSGINPNGTWSLFAFDFAGGDEGDVNGGWSLDITTQGGGGTPGWLTVTSGQSGSSSGTVNYTVAENTTGQARTGTIIIAGQTFTVNQSNQQTRRQFDFDGDGKTDLSIFRPSVGEWWYLRSSDGSNRTFQFGNSSDRLVPGDYTGDGKTDIAFFRPSTNEWFILRSENNSFFSFPLGAAGDVPAPADYDGDGKTDAAVFRPSNNTWFISRSTGGTTIQQFGISGDVPVTADYDGDGKSDIAIYRPSQGQWWLSRSSLGVIVYQFGVSTDKPVQGDYTGDGKTDVAFFRPSTNEWFILRSENNSFYSFPFGAANDIPSPGDYDGDGKFDAAIFRPSNNTWFVQRSTSGTLIQGFGIAGDKPIPNVFVP